MFSPLLCMAVAIRAKHLPGRYPLIPEAEFSGIPVHPTYLWCITSAVIMCPSRREHGEARHEHALQ